MTKGVRLLALAVLLAACAGESGNGAVVCFCRMEEAGAGFALLCAQNP